MWLLVAQVGLAIDTGKVLLVYGPLGAMVVGLAIAVIVLWKKADNLHTKRLADYKDMSEQYRDALEANTKAIEDHTRALWEDRR